MDAKPPPNVLLVITDQQRAADAGFMGNPVLKTPNLDALASRAMVFDNAWVANPVCMPNRSSLMTGRMPSAHGVIFNDRSLEPGVNTFVRGFRKSGYRTALIGKSHLQHGVSKNSMVPFRGGPSSQSPYPVGWDAIEDYEQYTAGPALDPEDYYGFGQIELSLDHGASVAGHHLQWALENGGEISKLAIDQDCDTQGSKRSKHWRQIYQPPYEERLHSTRFVTERTLAFIDAAHQRQEPFLAVCSFPDPHHPLTPPGRWFDAYRPEDMMLPASRHDDLKDAPAHLRLFKDIHPKAQRNWVSPCGYGSDALLAEAIAATYGMIGMIDEGVGEILARIESLGLSENTIIVFTSDHGDMMGEHGLFLKGFMHYRGTLQVPLLIRVPGHASGRTQALASTIDLGPTLMAACGITAFDGLQGHSLMPTIASPSTSVRDFVLIEDDVPLVTAKLTPIPARTRTLVKDGYRYTRNSKGEEQLFHLDTDPDEMVDVKKTDPKRIEMLETLSEAMMMADDSSRGAPATDSM